MKGVRGLRLGLCFLRVPILIGPGGGFKVISGLKRGCWNAGNPNGGNPGNEVGGCQPFNAGKRPPTFGC